MSFPPDCSNARSNSGVSASEAPAAAVIPMNSRRLIMTLPFLISRGPTPALVFGRSPLALRARARGASSRVLPDFLQHHPWPRRRRWLAWYIERVLNPHRAVRLDPTLLSHGGSECRLGRRDEHVAFPRTGGDVLHRPVRAFELLLRRRAVEQVHRRLRIAGNRHGDGHLAALDRDRPRIEAVGGFPLAREVRLVLSGHARHERDREGR